MHAYVTNTARVRIDFRKRTVAPWFSNRITARSCSRFRNEITIRNQGIRIKNRLCRPIRIGSVM